MEMLFMQEHEIGQGSKTQGQTTQTLLLEMILEEDNDALLQTIYQHIKDKAGVLHKACAAGAIKCVDVLLQKDIDHKYVNKKMPNGSTPLLLSLSNPPNANIARLLILHGATTRVKLVSNERTCLHLVCSNWHHHSDPCEILGILLQTDINVNLTDIFHQTPLEILVTKIMEPLKKAGDNPYNIEPVKKSRETSCNAKFTDIEFYVRLQKGINLLLSAGAVMDPRIDPQVCEKIIGYIQESLMEMWKELSDEVYHNDNMDRLVRARLPILILAFTQVCDILDMLVTFGAVLNYEQFSCPQEVNETKAFFYSRHVLLSEDKLDMYILYKSIKDFLFMVIMSCKMPVNLQRRLEPALCVLTRLLLAHGLSSREKNHILDHVQLAQVWNLTLNATNHSHFEKHLQMVVKKNDFCSTRGHLDATYWRHKVATPRSLKQQSRLVIHRFLGKQLTHKLNKLELPCVLKTYLTSFND